MTLYYQADEYKWIVRTDPEIIFYSEYAAKTYAQYLDQGESYMASKNQFISRTQDAVVQLALLHEQITGLSGVFVARGYASAGADPITDEDLLNAGSNLTATQFNTLVVPLLAEYLAFCNNAAVATKDRKSPMNIARKDI